MTSAEAIRIARAVLIEYGDIEHTWGVARALDPCNRDQAQRAAAYNALGELLAGSVTEGATNS